MSTTGAVMRWVPVNKQNNSTKSIVTGVRH
jgi:hypothetical protein